MGTPRIDSVKIAPRSGSMDDVFTFTLHVTADITEIRLLELGGKKVECFNENNCLIRKIQGNICQWIIQSQFFKQGINQLKLVAVNKKGETAIKEVAVTVNYKPLVYNVRLEHNSTNLRQEVCFILTLDLWADAIMFSKNNGYLETISLSDPRISVLTSDSDSYQKTIAFRPAILNIANKVISFRALCGGMESPISCVKLYVPERNQSEERIERLLTVARAEIGYKERAVNFTKYGAWFNLNGQPWCAMFVGWVFALSGNGNLFPRTPSVIAGMSWFKSRGLWGNTPRVGAVVFFGFKDGFYHEGIVESINDNGTVTVIEGNVSDKVLRQTHYIDNKYNKRKIIGYGYPNY